MIYTNQIFYEKQVFTWSDLADNVISLVNDVKVLQQRKLLFSVSNQYEAVSCFVLGIVKELDFSIIKKERLSNTLKLQLEKKDITIIDLKNLNCLPNRSKLENVRPGRISVLTSGTTGLPKLIPHTVESLNTYNKIEDLVPNIWFLPYEVGSYAWYQMIFMCLFVKDQYIVLADSDNIIRSFEDSINYNITAISSTPTFWRQAMFSIDSQKLKEIKLKFISLGGEIVDQTILDVLSDLYPDASIRHIYASSETGSAIIVTDKKAGFEKKLLEHTDNNILLRVENNKLFIKSCYSNTDTIGNWVDTGDIVKIVEDRVLFCGRSQNQMINVGGQKAYPALIESIILSHPNVLWAQVTAKKSAIMGYLPVATLVLKEHLDQFEIEKSLTMFCEQQLPDYAVPKLWNFVDKIPHKSSLKS